MNGKAYNFVYDDVILGKDDQQDFFFGGEA